MGRTNIYIIHPAQCSQLHAADRVPLAPALARTTSSRRPENHSLTHSLTHSQPVRIIMLLMQWASRHTQSFMVLRGNHLYFSVR